MGESPIFRFADPDVSPLGHKSLLRSRRPDSNLKDVQKETDQEPKTMASSLPGGAMSEQGRQRPDAMGWVADA
ncbi:hypothetical protein E4U58_007175 [Claviceps cyperi]|nr:hypothetical protein E4U58_007175 [Claviceps cyperi]